MWYPNHPAGEDNLTCSAAEYAAEAVFNTPNGTRDGVYPPTNILAMYTSSGSGSDPQPVDALPAGSTPTAVVDPMTTHDPSALRDHMDNMAEGEVADEPMLSVEATSEHDRDTAELGDTSTVTAMDTTAAGAPISPRS